jgi:hypothetical protein
MNKIIFSIILLIILSLPSFAQTLALVDEFPKISLEDLLARLDYLGSELMKNENSTVLIKVYGGEENLQGFPYRYAAMMKTHLTNSKIDEMNILTQQCDGEKEVRIKTYIIPPKAKIPECEKSLLIPAETTRFDSYYYSFEYPGFDDCCAITGSDRASAEASLKAFAELLKKSPESNAYLISYNGTNIHWVNNKTIRILDSSSLGRATAKNAKETLIQNGIDASKIITINGGYKDSNRNVELWFVPKDGEIPKPKPNYFPKKKPKTKRK